MSAPEHLSPPVYGCAAGAVLHAHAGDTLEPAVLLHTFLPPQVSSALQDEPVRVDVHGDGPGSDTLTLRLLVAGTALSWRLPIVPFVAALPGQSGDEGRMVLLGLVDAEPEPGWAQRPADCESLAAELQLPVTDLAEALRGRLTTWLADDLALLLHDDAHDRAVDRSPAQTLATAVLATYRAELDAEQAVTRVVQALELAPPEYTSELGSRLCAALATALEAAPQAVQAVHDSSGPFETVLLRQLDTLPALLAGAPAAGRIQQTMDVLLEAPDRDEAVRAAVSVIARLARSGFGPELDDAEVLRRLGMVDDSGLARLATLWVQLAAGAAREPSGDPLVAREVAERALVEGGPAVAWLGAAAAQLLVGATPAPGRSGARVAHSASAVRELLEAQDVSVDLLARAGEGMLELARFVRSKKRMGPGSWLHLPAPLVAAVLLEQWADGLAPELVVDLLDELLDTDVEPTDLLDAMVCATAQLLVEVEPGPDEAWLRTQVDSALSALPAGPRSARWLLLTVLQEAHGHDPGAVALAPLLPRESVDPDRSAERLGRPGVLRAGLAVMEALADSFGAAGRLPRQVSLAMFLSSALSEHDLLRQPVGTPDPAV